MLEIGVHESQLSKMRAAELVYVATSRGLSISSILDVGCRAGFALETFRELLPKAQLGGVDLLASALELARDHADVVYELDAGNLHPIDEAAYDWAFCSHTLEHCANIPAVVEELVRVSRVGVFLVVPLESDAKFNSYKGMSSPDGELGMHLFNSMDPLVWLRFFANTGMILYESRLSPEHSDLTAIFLHPGQITYGGRIYS